LFPERYDNFIGGKWVAPLDGEYVENVTRVNGRPFVKVARSKAAEVELALDAAYAVQPRWGLTSTTERAPGLRRSHSRGRPRPAG
jgi:aldehyde dehydrogenase